MTLVHGSHTARTAGRSLLRSSNELIPHHLVSAQSGEAQAGRITFEVVGDGCGGDQVTDTGPANQQAAVGVAGEPDGQPAGIGVEGAHSGAPGQRIPHDGHRYRRALDGVERRHLRRPSATASPLQMDGSLRSRLTHAAVGETTCEATAATRLATMTGFVEVSTATDSREAAQQLARSAVQARLAAGAQIVGPVESVFWHLGEFGTGQEWRLLFKTHMDRFTELEAHLLEHHPWKNPEISAVPIVAGPAGYLNWLRRTTAVNSEE
jgi:periplasmic divalent cation tolerance protein